MAFRAIPGKFVSAKKTHFVTFNPIKPGVLGLLIPGRGHIVPPLKRHENYFIWTLDGPYKKIIP